MTANGQTETAMTHQRGFGTEMTQRHGETSAVAVAAQAKAAIEARWIVAMRMLRDIDQVRTELLKECKRPAFAKVARYRKPIGKGIEGLSIRFVEQALQLMGNIITEATVIYDDEEKRIVQVSVTDLERNVTHPKQVTVVKTVERHSSQGYEVVGKRTNKKGKTVYIVKATDDDLLTKEAALVSKALRTCGLRLIPGWLQDECEQQIIATARDEDAKDPDAARKRCADGFAALGVQPADLAEYLGHELAKCTVDEVGELRLLYAAIRDGEANWHEVLAERIAERDSGGSPAPKKKAKEKAPAKGVEGAKEKVKKATAKKKGASKKKKAAKSEEPPAETEPPAQPQPPPAKADQPIPPPDEAPAPPFEDDQIPEDDGEPPTEEEVEDAEAGEDHDPEDDIPDWAK